MVPALRSLLDLVEVTYAAALDPSRWVDALHLLARLFEGNGAGLHVERAGSPVTQRWVGLDTRFIEAYRERYWREDPWAPGARRLAHGAVGFGDDLVLVQAIHEQRPVAGLVLIRVGPLADGVVAWFGPEARDLKAGNVVAWGAIEEMHRLGCTIYDVGGTNSDKGFSTFKAGMKGEDYLLLGEYVGV